MDAKEFELQLNDLETRVDRLRALYENWFRGYEKTEPHVARKDVERRVYGMRKELPRNTALRFRYHQLYQRYTTLANYWHRTAKQIEEGTYRLQLQRMRRKGANATGRGRRELDSQRPGPRSYELDPNESLSVDDLLSDFEMDELAREVDSPDFDTLPPPVARARTNAGRESRPAPRVRPGALSEPPSLTLRPAPRVSQRPQPKVSGLPPPPSRASLPGAPPAGPNSSLPRPPPPVPGPVSSAPRPAPTTPGVSAPRPAPTAPAATGISAPRPAPTAPTATGLSAPRPAPTEPGGTGTTSLPRPPPTEAVGTGTTSLPRPAPTETGGTGTTSLPRSAPAEPAASGTAVPHPAPMAPAATGTVPRPAPTAPAGSVLRPAPAGPKPAPLAPTGASAPKPTPATPEPAPAFAKPTPSATFRLPNAGAPARPAQPSAPTAQASRADTQVPNEERLKRIYDEYTSARRRNNEGEVRFDHMVSSIQKMLPELQKKHQGKSIDFEVVVKDGRVGLKPKAK
ncbi:MAG: MXAN_5187 C-terminal domain-containing protein [Myxococcales bacterium]